MRVMVVIDNGMLAHEQEVGPGQAFVLEVDPSNRKALASFLVDHARVQILPEPADRLDLADRVLLAWAVAFQAGALVILARAAGHPAAVGFLLAAAAAWGYLLRKTWRATR